MKVFLIFLLLMLFIGTGTILKAMLIGTLIFGTLLTVALASGGGLLLFLIFILVLLD